ncbi:hypothetical protein BDQ17DRAFT_1332674 [Cyathus striatus]|nr:hypothetical protein BDQ17DRAFT_1332674 [Cyathus striatus]
MLKKLKAKAERFFSADHCLFVYESKAWNLLGSFETVIIEDEEVDWLMIDAGDEESPTDLDLWGFESDHYMFLHLKKWLKEKVEKRKGKGKSKSKEEKGDKDEDTIQRKEKSK